eukprot:CAMPEP_0173446638 /NCGR_PEP_ID=MMETSP1357-20121228/37018_1 /TAXON_ID=77926 /ORGANISM="Hemiselmis rufescens, Strain PCC563" /LENGTH=45 /DNA_ID= /DNA_START= /DNA_END= /DNA_ORIENTATION=
MSTPATLSLLPSYEASTPNAAAAMTPPVRASLCTKNDVLPRTLLV